MIASGVGAGLNEVLQHALIERFSSWNFGNELIWRKKAISKISDSNFKGEYHRKGNSRDPSTGPPRRKVQVYIELSSPTVASGQYCDREC